jgi:hypothetical protein
LISLLKGEKKELCLLLLLLKIKQNRQRQRNKNKYRKHIAGGVNRVNTAKVFGILKEKGRCGLERGAILPKVAYTWTVYIFYCTFIVHKQGG